jgi:hypothetical protein
MIVRQERNFTGKIWIQFSHCEVYIYIQKDANDAY